MNDSTFLFVDDRPRSLATTYGTIDENRIRIKDPNSTTLSDVEWASVVLADYNIDATLPEKDSAAAQLANVPRTGTALVATMRSLEEAGVGDLAAPFRAYVLISAQIELIGTLLLPPDYLAHVGAGSLGVDWIFQKPRSIRERADFGRRLESLGGAVSRVREIWNHGKDQVDELRTLLQIPANLDWTDRAWGEVVEAHPRLRDPAERVRPRPVFRWLLQEALPFPGVLLDSSYLAGRLRVDPGTIESVLTGGLADLISSALYAGIFSDFFSQRWWRAGVEQILWDSTQGRSFDVHALREFTGGASRTDGEELVVTLDENLSPNAKLTVISSKELELVRPLGWPNFAERPWMASKDRESAINYLEQPDA